MNLKKYYEAYWQHRQKHNSIYTKTPTRIVVATNHIDHSFPQTILDIGCGEGRLGLEAKAKNTHHHLTGTDISTQAIKLARPNYDRLIQLDLENVTRDPLHSQQFDTIVSTEVIEHLVNPAKLIQYAYDHLKNTGKFIVSFPNTAWWKYRVDLLKGRFIDETPTYTHQDHLHFFTLNTLSTLLKQSGFWVEIIDGNFTLPWYFGRLPQDLQRVVGRLFPGLFGYQLVLICRKKSEKPTIAHIMRDYLNPSEPWLYSQLTTSTKTSPIVLTRNRKNVNHFPFSAIYHYQLLSDYIQGNRLWQSIIRKILAGFQRWRDMWGSETNYYQKIVNASDAKLIHAHYGETGRFALKLKQQTNLPFVTTFYGTDAYQKNNTDLFRKSDAIIVLGPRMKQSLISYGCEAKKISIINQGVDIQAIPFSPRQKTKTPQLLIASRLVEFKGIPIAIRAFKQVTNQFPTAKLTIIGSGPQESIINQQIAKLNLTDKIKLVPFVPHQELIAITNKHHLFLQPSITLPNGSREGIPTSLIERVASGMPVIATDHSDIPEIVHDGINGFLVPENDPDSFAQKIIFLLSHQELWAKFGTAGRKLVEAKFDIRNQTVKREAVYMNLLKAKS